MPDDDAWIGFLTGKRRNAYLEMIDQGLWQDGYTEKDIDKYIDRDEVPERRRRRDEQVGGPRSYHKTYYGRGRDLDRLAMAKKMAIAQDIIADFVGAGDGIRKRTRILADGSVLKYRSAGPYVGKIIATAPPSQVTREEIWSSMVSEMIDIMDDPDAMYQIQPAYMVWEDPEGEIADEPCGLLITHKFGPPYWYLPRILKKDNEEIEMFTVAEMDVDEGGNYVYQLTGARGKEKTRYVSYLSSGIEATTYVTTRLANCHRAAAGKYKYENEDIEVNYHGMPEVSNGMQEIYAYHFCPDVFYKWYDCVQQKETGGTEDDRNYQRYAINYHGDGEVTGTEYNYLIGWYFREDEWSRGWSQKSRLFFEGDCGRILIADEEEVFDAAYRASNWLNLFLYWPSAYQNLGVNIDENHQYGTWYKSALWTIEYLKNYAPEELLDDERWPHELTAYPSVLGGGGSYYATTTSLTRNVNQKNEEEDQYLIGDEGHTPYYHNFNIPIEQNCRNNCHDWCSCPVPLGKEWCHSGIGLGYSFGQVLRASDGQATQEWIAFVEESIMADCYLDHWAVTNNFTDITVKTSRGYEHYFGKAGAPAFRSSYSIEGAVIYDCRSPRQAIRKDLQAASVFEISIQDGTNDKVTNYPQYLGPIKTWGEGCGGGRTGRGLVGKNISLTGEDRYEIGFILTGTQHRAQPNPNAPRMEIESGGSDAVCWRRIITPDIIHITDEEERYVWYSFEEEKNSGAWPPKIPISGVKPEDEENGFPEGGHFRRCVVPVKIYYRPRNWLRTVRKPGKTEEDHGIRIHTEDEF